MDIRLNYYDGGVAAIKSTVAILNVTNRMLSVLDPLGYTTITDVMNLRKRIEKAHPTHDEIEQISLHPSGVHVYTTDQLTFLSSRALNLPIRKMTEIVHGIPDLTFAMQYAFEQRENYRYLIVVASKPVTAYLNRIIPDIKLYDKKTDEHLHVRDFTGQYKGVYYPKGAVEGYEEVYSFLAAPMEFIPYADDK